MIILKYHTEKKLINKKYESLNEIIDILKALDGRGENICTEGFCLPGNPCEIPVEDLINEIIIQNIFCIKYKSLYKNNEVPHESAWLKNGYVQALFC